MRRPFVTSAVQGAVGFAFTLLAVPFFFLIIQSTKAVQIIIIMTIAFLFVSGIETLYVLLPGQAYTPSASSWSASPGWAPTRTTWILSSRVPHLRRSLSLSEYRQQRDPG